MSAKPAVDERQLPRYVGQAAVARMLNCSVRTLQRIRNDDATFPKPVVNGKQRKAWRVDDILVWDDARHSAARAQLIKSAVSSADDIRDDDVVDAHRALAVRLAKAQGVAIEPDAVVGFTYQLTAEQRQAVADEATAQQRGLIEDILSRLDGLHFVEALMLLRAFLPPLRRFADESLKLLGIEISMSDDDWREAGLLVVDRVINGDVVDTSAHPRDVVGALADDGIFTRSTNS